MLKKFYQERFFNWTVKDVHDWERIRAKGLGRFILLYGFVLFGGVLFTLMGGIAVLSAWAQGQSAGLMPQLGFIAITCIAGGMICGILTWVMEEKLYQKFEKIHRQEK